LGTIDVSRFICIQLFGRRVDRVLVALKEDRKQIDELLSSG
jgi:hypothetical protein